MENLRGDITYAIRNLWKRPGFTLIAVLTLAVGIGANACIFSAIYSLLLKPLPFPDLDRIVAIWNAQPSKGVDHNEVAVGTYLEWQAQSQSFEQLALYRWWTANLSGTDSPERVQGFLVTANFLNTLGMKPIMGRDFLPEENQPGKDRVAIITHSLWQRRFGGDPNIINKAITVNSIVRTVVGVMPERFNYPKGSEVYAPLEMTPEFMRSRRSHSFYVIGRMKPGVSIASAQADISNISARLEQQYPESNKGWGAALYPILTDTVRGYDTPIWVSMYAVAFVLLIACANVANLMLARASGRQREIALRAALGASRWRIVRQLLTESVIVALIGGVLGVLVALWGIDALRASNPGDAERFAPGWYQLGINFTVLAFTLGISLLSGIIFGLAPALHVSKPNLNDSLKEGSRQTTGHSHGLRSALVVFEVALSLMLLIGAGLSVRSFLSLMKTNPGFDPDNVLTMAIVLPAVKYTEEPGRVAFYQDLVQRVKAHPGVESAAAVNYIPLGGANSSDGYLVEGVPEPAAGEENIARYRVSTPDYFRTIGAQIVKGRGFTDGDKAGTLPVVVVNETFVRKHWPNEDPIGKRIRLYGPLDRAPWMEVVGVLQDIKHELNFPVSPEFYVPHAQDGWNSMVLVAKTKGDPNSLAAALRQQVWAIDKDQAVFDVRSMEDVRMTSVSMFTSAAVMLGILAGIALLLATIGIYGVMAFAVTQRTQEIGIRMALGARALDVLKLVVRNGMKLAVIGIAIGLVGSWAVTRFMEALLVGVKATDLLTFTLVSICLLVAALLACYLPARRATKVDPLEALRYE